MIYERNTLANKLLEKEGIPTQMYQPQLETATKKYDFDGIPEEAKKNIIQRGSQPADNIDNNITKKSQSSRGGLGELLMSGASMLGKYAFEKMTEETKPQKVTFRETQTEPDQGSMERIKPELTTSKMEETIMPLEKIVPQLSTTETQTEPRKPKLTSDVFKKMHEKQQAERKELEKPKKIKYVPEDENYSIDYPDPIEAIKFRMEQLGYNQSDLASVIGLKSRVSEILLIFLPEILIRSSLKVSETLLGDFISMASLFGLLETRAE